MEVPLGVFELEYAAPPGYFIEEEGTTPQGEYLARHSARYGNSTSSYELRIYYMPAAVRASFTSTQGASSSYTYIFDPRSSSTDGNPTYTWDFGDGTTLIAEEPDMHEHHFPGPGTYEVTLTVTHETGITFDTAAETITIPYPPVSIDFNPAYDFGQVDLLIRSRDDSTQTWQVTPGIPMNDLPAGEYTLEITTLEFHADFEGESYTAHMNGLEHDFEVPNESGRHRITVPFAPHGGTVSIPESDFPSGVTPPPLGDYLEITRVDISNPPLIDINSDTLTLAPGVYDLIYKNVIVDGETYTPRDSNTRFALSSGSQATPAGTTYEPELTADFTVSGSLYPQQELQFTPAISGGHGSLTGHWDFDDGTSATATGDFIDFNPTHTYASAGNYTVTLTVEDESGQDATSIQTVTVNEGITYTLNVNGLPEGADPGAELESDATGQVIPEGQWNALPPGDYTVSVENVMYTSLGVIERSGGGTADLEGYYIPSQYEHSFTLTEDRTDTVNYTLTPPAVEVTVLVDGLALGKSLPPGFGVLLHYPGDRDPQNITQADTTIVPNPDFGEYQLELTAPDGWTAELGPSEYVIVNVSGILFKFQVDFTPEADMILEVDGVPDATFHHKNGEDLTVPYSVTSVPLDESISTVSLVLTDVSETHDINARTAEGEFVIPNLTLATGATYTGNLQAGSNSGAFADVSFSVKPSH